MSHAATNWAIQQRGLKPTTKIVLWHLCDRFNPDYGCFPSQDRLAHDCEISRSTLNDHLGQLEAVGLLRRVPRLDPVTRRQLPTRYILGFEPGFTPVGGAPCPDLGHGEDGSAEIADMAEGSPLEAAAEALPCPEFGHGDDPGAVSDFDPEPCPETAPSRVRNPDTNPVREPLREPVKEEEDAQARAAAFEGFFAELIAALGLDPAALPGWWQGWPPRLHVQRWRDALGLSEDRILEVARASRRDHPEPPDGPKALDRAMERAAHAARVALQTGGASGGSIPRTQRSEAAQRSATLEEMAAFYADRVNADGFLPPSMISTTIRDILLTRGLVTPERLQARGVL